jgi:regulator of protease activity HflC (stomatin/prohibitin superfamily)
MRTITVRVRNHERGLLFRDNEFQRMLDPGVYRLWRNVLRAKRSHIELVTPLRPRLEHPLLDVLLADPRLGEATLQVNLAETQRALVWIDGRLAAVHGPGRYAYWKAPAKVEVEVHDVSELRLEHPRLEAIVAHREACAWLEVADVEQNHEVLLFRSGKLAERLAPGKHAFWKGAGRLTVRAVDKRERLADVAGQEILTSDKVSLRGNLIVTYQVVDALRAVSTVADQDQAVYREAQLALRAAVGTRTLDALLADKESVGAEVRAALTARAAEFGVEVRSVGLRDIILPGEMRAILNQVIEAQKRAEADLIRRREETAAARSQSNTARLLAENPVLARMRELELLQGVLAGTRATLVLGRGDIAEQVHSLLKRDAPTDAS